MRRSLARLSGGLDNLCRWGAGAAFAGMVVFIGIQVVARYIFQTLPSWTEELARFSMVWGGMLGATVAFKARFDPVLGKMSDRGSAAAARAMNYLRAAAIMVFMVPVAYYSFVGPGRNLARGFLGRSLERTADTLRFPMIYVAVAIPLAVVIILVHLAEQLADDDPGH